MCPGSGTANVRLRAVESATWLITVDAMENQQPQRSDLGARIVEDATERAAGEARTGLEDDLLRSAEAALRAAAGAIEEESAEFAIDKIDPAIAKYRGSGS
jgi:hypothetical protein